MSREDTAWKKSAQFLHSTGLASDRSAIISTRISTSITVGRETLLNICGFYGRRVLSTLRWKCAQKTRKSQSFFSLPGIDLALIDQICRAEWLTSSTKAPRALFHLLQPTRCARDSELVVLTRPGPYVERHTAIYLFFLKNEALSGLDIWHLLPSEVCPRYHIETTRRTPTPLLQTRTDRIASRSSVCCTRISSPRELVKSPQVVRPRKFELPQSQHGQHRKAVGRVRRVPGAEDQMRRDEAGVPEVHTLGEDMLGLLPRAEAARPDAEDHNQGEAGQAEGTATERGSRYRQERPGAVRHVLSHHEESERGDPEAAQQLARASCRQRLRVRLFAGCLEGPPQEELNEHRLRLLRFLALRSADGRWHGL